jgi:hypothetical protein
MTERVQCANEDCERTILIATAKKTGGVCMPCHQAKERKEREKYIRENRKDINVYEGIDDPVELIKLIHTTQPNDPLINYVPCPIPIEKLYSNLSEFELHKLVAYIKEMASSDGIEAVETMALELASFQCPNLTELQKIMLNNHEYYPSLLFKNADNLIVTKLLARLETEVDNRNLILLALAWACTDQVVAEFNRWRTETPSWSNNLNIPPQNYSKEAGWVVSGEGKKQYLFFDKAYPLINEDKSYERSTFNTCIKSKKLCKWCNRNLTNLIEIDLCDPIFSFLTLKAKRLEIATCDVCSCYSDALFMEITDTGEANWSEYNERPSYLPDDSDTWEYMPQNSLSLSPKSRAADYAANEFLPTTFSQIGGMPTWIQDFAYPTCPKCNDTMMFLAQVSNEDIEEYGEGIYYSYICPSCNITATNYQQT